MRALTKCRNQSRLHHRHRTGRLSDATRRCFIRMTGSFLIGHRSSSGLLSMLAMAALEQADTSQWMLLTRSRHAWSTACLTQIDFCKALTISFFKRQMLPREHPRVAVFGECADLLWKQGYPEAAIQDEKLCNQLCKRYDVDILCAYSRDNVEGVLDEAVSQICAEHSAVCSA